MPNFGSGDADDFNKVVLSCQTLLLTFRIKLIVQFFGVLKKMKKAEKQGPRTKESRVFFGSTNTRFFRKKAK